MDNTRIPVLYIVGNYSIDLVMGTLTHWPAQGTEMMLEHSTLRPDGSTGSCALAAAAMQLPHCTIGYQGDDAFTPRLATQFPGGSAHWPQCPCETSLTVAITHPNRKRSFLSNHEHITRLTAGGVLSQLPATTGEGDIVLLCGTFLCTGLLSDYPQLLATLRQRGFTLVVNTGWPPQSWSNLLRHEVDRWLGDYDWLLLNDVETLQLASHPTLVEATAALAARLSDRDEYVVKCDADGADYWTTNGHRHASTRSITVIDTIGAGGSFDTGSLTALLSGKLAAATLRWGNTIVAQAIGASPRHYPDWHTLQHHLEEATGGQC